MWSEPYWGQVSIGIYEMFNQNPNWIENLNKYIQELCMYLPNPSTMGKIWPTINFQAE